MKSIALVFTAACALCASSALADEGVSDEVHAVDAAKGDGEYVVRSHIRDATVSSAAHAATFDPWVALAGGFARLPIAGRSDVVESGVTFAKIRWGGDVPANDEGTIGGSLRFAVGRYSSCTSDVGGNCSLADVARESFSFALRVSYDAL